MIDAIFRWCSIFEYRHNTSNSTNTKFKKAPNPEGLHDRIDPGRNRTIVGVAQAPMVPGVLTAILDHSPRLQPADETSIFCLCTMGPFMDLIGVGSDHDKQYEFPA